MIMSGEHTVGILSSIRISYNTFTPLQRRIADYVLEDPKRVISLGISEFAEKVDSGEATISRFCQALGCKNYQTFKLDIAKVVYTEEAEESQLVSERKELDEMDDFLQQCISALNATRSLQRKEDIDLAVEWISNASHVGFFGVGASLIFALSAYEKFSRICRGAMLAYDAQAQIINATMMSSGDVAVMFSYSGASKATVLMAKQAKERGAKVISVTYFRKSLLVNYSDLTLLCGTDEGILQDKVLLTDMAMQYVTGLLYEAYCKRNADRVQPLQQAVSDALVEALY